MNFSSWCLAGNQDPSLRVYLENGPNAMRQMGRAQDAGTNFS
jgi:hypothetical protein